MSRALIVPFHRYPGLMKNWDQILFAYFMKKYELWGKYFDRIYLIDSNHYFSSDLSLPDQFMILHTENHSHAQNLNEVFNYVSEDIVMIIDHDTLLYSDGFKYPMEAIEKSTLDVAAFIEKPEGKGISRFAPYFFIGKRSVLPAKPDFSEAPPEHLDPLAKLTHEILPHVNYAEVYDDRRTIQLTKDGHIICKEDTNAADTGVYHVRNFMGGVVLADTYKNDPEDFRRRFGPMPFEEITRLFGWAWLLNEKTLESWDLEDQIMAILTREMEVEPVKWQEFMEEFRKFHHYV